MPPALSDDEASSSSVEEETVPIRSRRTKSDSPAKPAHVDNEVDDQEDKQEDEDEESSGNDGDEEAPNEQDEDEEEVFVVERILKHQETDEGIFFQVQWENYPKKSDFTWEPESNLESAQDVVDAYWASKTKSTKGSRGRTSRKKDEESGNNEPEDKKNGTKNAAGTKRKGRKSVAGADENSSTSTPASKRVKQEWRPPAGSWEHDVHQIESVDESLDPKTGQLKRYGYVIWMNGRKTQHPVQHLYQKCPQKTLLYYEKHLVFNPGPDLEHQLTGSEYNLIDGNGSTKKA